MRIGNALKKIRESQGFSAKYVATKAGIPTTTYSNYENDNREPGLDNLKKISIALNVKADVLINEDQYLKSCNDVPTVVIEGKKQYILNSFDRLNDEGKEKAMELIEMVLKINEYKK